MLSWCPCECAQPSEFRGDTQSCEAVGSRTVRAAGSLRASKAHSELQLGTVTETSDAREPRTAAVPHPRRPGNDLSRRALRGRSARVSTAWRRKHSLRASSSTHSADQASSGD